MPFVRMKRVSDPLDDRVKARIFGTGPSYSSSGSEYSAQADDDATSSSLSDLFFGFTVDDDDSGGDSSLRGDFETDSERGQPIYEPNDENVDLIKPILVDRSDAFQKLLTDQVLKGLQLFSCLKSNSKQMLRRNVMAFLRDCGYNAAICKTKWESCGGLTAGNYEFIDVVRAENSVRYFVDLEFACEFEIARPTSSYERLMQCIPCVFVGKTDDLKQILKTVSDGVKRSLKSRGLLLPPWRKYRFMQNKWLGPYRRTTNLYPVSCSSSSASKKQSYSAAKCCAVGFDATVSGQLSFSAATRTR